MEEETMARLREVKVILTGAEAFRLLGSATAYEVTVVRDGERATEQSVLAHSALDKLARAIGTAAGAYGAYDVWEDGSEVRKMGAVIEQTYTRMLGQVCAEVDGGEFTHTLVPNPLRGWGRDDGPPAA